MLPAVESDYGVLAGPEAFSRVPTFEELLNVADPGLPEVERELLRRAWDFALAAHAGQQRASGAPYFSHAAHTGLELARLGLDGATVAAGLLHDVVEDTTVTSAELEAKFGAEVARLVDGVTKISVRLAPSGDEAKAENLRKMLVAMAKDVRVLLIKLADRLHNMRTLVFLKEEKQRRIAAETLEVYAQLANRLGIHQWKWELEDRCMAVLYPREYSELSVQIESAQGDRAARLQEAQQKLKAKLADAGIHSEISGRNKHLWSIYQKLLKSHKRFEELYDLVALRVVTGSVPDCYAAMGIIHALWTPLPGRVKDYIAIPKSNMYQSLHTTVVGPLGLPLEIQVRTDEMHRTSERGIAAHWRYKAAQRGDEAAELPFLKNVLEWQKDSRDASEFVENLKIDLYDEEVFIFTPKGEVKMLPKGSTVIDFAYAVHSSVGDQVYGAVVNGKMAPLRHELNSGDIVRVLTSAQHRPNKDWLLYARTSKAKNRIRRTLRHLDKEADARKGREALEKLFKRQGLKIHDLARSSTVMEAARGLGFQGTEDLFAAVGSREMDAKAVLERLAPAHSPEQAPAAAPKARPMPKTLHQGVEVKGFSGMLVSFARCCSPVTGDPILGYVTVGRGVSIHRTDCVNAPDLLRKAERLVEVRWAGEGGDARMVELEVAAWDRPNIMAEMLLAVARTTSPGGRTSNLSAASATTLEGGMAQARFTVGIFDLEHLKRLMLHLYQVEGVTSVKRRDRRLKLRSSKETPPAAPGGMDASDSA